MGSAANDAELVLAARAGDGQAFTVLFERWFDRSYDVAWRIVRNRDTAAEVAQDTFLNAWSKLESLRDPEAFGGWVLRSARNRALNRLEREGRSMAFDTEDTVGLIDQQRSAVDIADDIVRREQHDLVWAAAQALGERDASILDLHLRHDLGPAEIAEALDIAPNAAHQTLFRLRKRLEGAIRSYVLWQDGEPECDDLARALSAAEVATFGPRAVKTISGHVAGCEACERRHSDILAPASMFAAVPILLVGFDVKRAAAAELASHGVPIQPDALSALPAPEPQAQEWTAIALAESGGGGSQPPARKAAMAAAVVAVFLVVGAAGAGLLDQGDGTYLEAVATTEADSGGPGTTIATSSTGAPSTVVSDEPGSTATSKVPSSVAPTIVTSDVPRTVTTARPPDSVSTTVSTTGSTTVSTTGSTSTTETTIVTRVPAPVILRFTATDTGRACTPNWRGSRLYRLTWATEQAEGVTLGGSLEAPRGQQAPSGQVEACLPAQMTGYWTLTATGPGGTVTSTVDVP